MVKKVYLVLSTVIFLLFLISFINAIKIISVTPDYVNRSISVQVNMTFNNTEALNITQLSITLPMESSFALGTNKTDAIGAFFSNSTGGIPPKITLTWVNTSTSGFLLTNNVSKSFLFNVSLRNLENSMFTNFTITTTATNGSVNTTYYNFVVYFGFAAYVKNETGGNESNVNVTLYRFASGQGGPPTEYFEASTVSDSSGLFSFPSINGSASGYKLRIIRYGLTGSGCVSANVSCNATKTGPSLPDFPAMMYYPSSAGNPEFEFMRPPTLNGTTFYLQPAVTLRLYANAYNGSDVARQKFGYEVVDQKVGFPAESNMMASSTTADIIIPTGRNYTVMFSRFFGGGGAFGFGFYDQCNGTFMNDTACPTPPISNASLGTLTAGQIVTLNQSLMTFNYYLTGCIKTAAGQNNSGLNITTVSLKMIPWEGFLPPVKADRGDINISNPTQLNYSFYATPINCSGGGSFAYYNFSVMGSASGMKYMIEVYAKNASDEANAPGGSAYNLATFQNITITGDTTFNLTLYKLAGSYYNTSDANTTRIKINIQNSTGGAITKNMNANVKVKNPIFGTMNYMIESMSSGSFYISVLNNSNWAKVMVMANDAPPKEIALNLSLGEQNVTLVTMSDGTGVGMKKINSSGQMEMINSTQLNGTMAINMRFLRNSDECNSITPPDSCALTSMSAKNFNPLLAMVAGKVNMEMKITATNVTLMFINFDMFAAKQPPMDSIMNDQASAGASSANQIWQFGSFAPANTYDYVIISMPYSTSGIDDSKEMNLSLPKLYDENWNVVWDKSRGDNSTNLTDDFIDYNSSALYLGYLNLGGMACNKTDPNLTGTNPSTACYVNTSSDMIYMRIPHFSGVGPSVSGTAPASSGGGSPGGSPSGNSIGTSITWKMTYVTEKEFSLIGSLSREFSAAGRIQLQINNEKHYVGVKSLTSMSALIEVSSTPQDATLNIGSEKKFDINNDFFYDVLVKLNSIENNKANLTLSSIHDAVPEEDLIVVEEETFEEEGGIGFPEGGGSNNWIIIIVVILLIIIISYAVFRSKKRRY